MDVYFDYDMDQWVGEYAYTNPDVPWETHRETEWFATKAEAVAFAESGVIV